MLRVHFKSSLKVISFRPKYLGTVSEKPTAGTIKMHINPRFFSTGNIKLTPRFQKSKKKRQQKSERVRFV